MLYQIDSAIQYDEDRDGKNQVHVAFEETSPSELFTLRVLMHVYFFFYCGSWIRYTYEHD